MYKMPSLTQRVTSSLADRNRAARRSKYIRKSRYQRTTPMTRTIYGKSIIGKLSANYSGTVSAADDFNAVHPIQEVMQNSADWANFRDAYALYNILHVTVQVYPNPGIAAGSIRLVGVCYDTKNNVAQGTIGAIHDHNQYLIMNFNQNSEVYTFRTRTKAVGTIPLSTSDLSANWGWIKFFAENADFGPPVGILTICKYVITVTVAFNSQQ